MKLSFLLVPIVSLSMLIGCTKNNATPNGGAGGGTGSNNTVPSGTKTVSNTNMNWNWGGARSVSAVINGRVYIGTVDDTYFVDSPGYFILAGAVETGGNTHALGNTGGLYMKIPVSLHNLKVGQEIVLEGKDGFINYGQVDVSLDKNKAIGTSTMVNGGTGRIKITEVTADTVEGKFYGVAKSGMANQIHVVIQQGYFRMGKKDVYPL